MLKRLINFCLFFVLISLFTIKISYSEIINKIEITGNERIADQTILMFSKIKIGSNLEKNEINNLLKSIYDTNFFKDVEVSLKNNKLLINVVENPIIESIKINGIKSKTLKEKILSNVELKSRSSYNKTLLKKSLDLMYLSLKDSGYYFSNILSLIHI